MRSRESKTLNDQSKFKWGSAQRLAKALGVPVTELLE